MTNYQIKEKDAVIATKVIMKMRNGELITHPSDERKFKGLLETLFYRLTDKPTGGAAPMPVLPHQVDYSGYLNPATATAKSFHEKQFLKCQVMSMPETNAAIMAQLKSIGIPYESDLELASMRGGLVYVRSYTRRSARLI